VPSWQPNWEDVRFDHAAAVEAAEACRRGATTADATAQAVTAAAPSASRDWSGSLSDDFRRELPELGDELSARHGELNALARQIEAAGDEARAEQARREQQRERWHDQARKEARRNLPE